MSDNHHNLTNVFLAVYLTVKGEPCGERVFYDHTLPHAEGHAIDYKTAVEVKSGYRVGKIALYSLDWASDLSNFD